MKISPIILVLALLGGLVVMGMDFQTLREYNRDNDPAANAAAPAYPPWGGYALRAGARDSASLWGVDPDSISLTLVESTQNYPLDARQWLNLARIEASLHGADSKLLGPHLEVAVAIQPFNRDTRWRAAQVALQAGDHLLAEQHLKQWLNGAPSSSQQALLVARRWLHNPDDLVERILPAGDDFLAQAMSFARQQRDPQLAHAVWQRLRLGLDLDHPVLLGYVDFLLDNGLHDQAVAIWEEHDPHYRVGGIANGDFSRALGASSGLNWRVDRLPSGVLLTRDEANFYYSPASLQIAFNGDHNVNLRTPWIRIPVTPGRRYELKGFWQGQRLTTRALPYLWLQAEGGRLNERVTIPGHTFDWSPWSMTFSVPDNVHVIRLHVRRDSTSNFDRYIAGQLWLDGIELEEAADIAPVFEPLDAASR